MRNSSDIENQDVRDGDDDHFISNDKPKNQFLRIKTSVIQKLRKSSSSINFSTKANKLQNLDKKDGQNQKLKSKLKKRPASFRLFSRKSDGNYVNSPSQAERYDPDELNKSQSQKFSNHCNNNKICRHTNIGSFAHDDNIVFCPQTGNPLHHRTSTVSPILIARSNSQKSARKIAQLTEENKQAVKNKKYKHIYLTKSVIANRDALYYPWYTREYNLADWIEETRKFHTKEYCWEEIERKFREDRDEKHRNEMKVRMQEASAENKNNSNNENEVFASGSFPLKQANEELELFNSYDDNYENYIRNIPFEGHHIKNHLHSDSSRLKYDLEEDYVADSPRSIEQKSHAFIMSPFANVNDWKHHETVQVHEQQQQQHMSSKKLDQDAIVLASAFNPKISSMTAISTVPAPPIINISEHKKSPQKFENQFYHHNNLTMKLSNNTTGNSSNLTTNYSSDNREISADSEEQRSSDRNPHHTQQLIRRRMKSSQSANFTSQNTNNIPSNNLRPVVYESQTSVPPGLPSRGSAISSRRESRDSQTSYGQTTSGNTNSQNHNNNNHHHYHRKTTKSKIIRPDENTPTTSKNANKNLVKSASFRNSRNGGRDYSMSRSYTASNFLVGSNHNRHSVCVFNDNNSFSNGKNSNSQHRNSGSLTRNDSYSTDYSRISTSKPTTRPTTIKKISRIKSKSVSKDLVASVDDFLDENNNNNNGLSRKSSRKAPSYDFYEKDFKGRKFSKKLDKLQTINKTQNHSQVPNLKTMTGVRSSVSVPFNSFSCK